MSRPPGRPSRIVATLAVVALTLLAGCSASALPGFGPSQPYDTPLNASEVEAGHTAALEDAGSATVVVETNLTIAGRTAGQGNVAVQQEFDDGPTYARMNASGATREVYLPANGTGYSRTSAGGGLVKYETVDGDRNASAFTELDVGQLVERYNFTVNGTADVGGETTYVYETQNASLVEGLPGDTEFGNVSARLYIRSDGLVKRVSVQAGSSEDLSLSMTRTYVDVGSTTVDEPTWLDDAKEATGS
jgi:hypothetical protein